MKRFILFALAYICSVFSLPLVAQDGDATFPNYVVIGAFAHQENAINFTDEAKHNRYPARFEMNPNRNLYYVYVLTTHDREYARAEALRLRAETKYFDAWVYSGVFGNIDIATIDVGAEQHDFNPVTGQRLENVTGGEQQRSTGQGNMVVGATPNERQTTTNPNRFVTNDSGQPVNNLTTDQARSDEQTESTSNERTGTGPRNAPENPRDATADESLIQPRDGERQTVNDPTRVAQQASLQPNRSDKQNDIAKDRRRETTTAGDGNDPAKQDGDASIRRGSSAREQQQASLLSNPKPSEKNQKQNTGIAGDPKPQESASNETSPIVTNKNAAKQTTSNTQEISGKSDNESQVPGPRGEADASMETEEANISHAVVNIPAPVRQSTEPLSSGEVVGKNFYFHLYRADNQKTVPGEVDAIDFEKSRKMGTYPANEGVKVTMAGGKMKHISFVCQVFGYRKQQQEFDPASPSELLYLDDKGNLVVPFELVRLQKGDIAIMYNVFFFKDAAVMRPESRYEVNNLLDLLVENPSYKVMIHGHTNGNASGKIIRMAEPGNFYSLSGTKQGFGSAKQLSEERALVIREFLISSGIPADRMQVKAWGGKKPIHDKHSVRAQENVRVEIEILSQ